MLSVAEPKRWERGKAFHQNFADLSFRFRRFKLKCSIQTRKIKMLGLNGTARFIEMKGITRCKLTIVSESAIVLKKFLGQIVSYPASLDF